MTTEQEKINESDQSMQERVRKNRESCDHVGFHTPLGHEVFQLEGELFRIVCSTMCMMCGMVWHSISTIKEKEKN